jgi:ATP-dependent DNA helicase PIF1
MRAKNDPWFAEYLLRIREARRRLMVMVKSAFLMIYAYHRLRKSDLDTLIDCIFLALNANMSNKSYIISRVILSQRNDWVDMINMKMISHFQGDEMVSIALIVRWMIHITTIHLSFSTL